MAIWPASDTTTIAHNPANTIHDPTTIEPTTIPIFTTPRQTESDSSTTTSQQNHPITLEANVTIIIVVCLGVPLIAAIISIPIVVSKRRKNRRLRLQAEQQQGGGDEDDEVSNEDGQSDVDVSQHASSLKDPLTTPVSFHTKNTKSQIDSLNNDSSAKEIEMVRIDINQGDVITISSSRDGQFESQPFISRPDSIQTPTTEPLSPTALSQTLSKRDTNPDFVQPKEPRDSLASLGGVKSIDDMMGDVADNENDLNEVKSLHFDTCHDSSDDSDDSDDNHVVQSNSFKVGLNQGGGKLSKFNNFEIFQNNSSPLNKKNKKKQSKKTNERQQLHIFVTQHNKNPQHYSQIGRAHV